MGAERCARRGVVSAGPVQVRTDIESERASISITGPPATVNGGLVGERLPGTTKARPDAGRIASRLTRPVEAMVANSGNRVMMAAFTRTRAHTCENDTMAETTSKRTARAHKLDFKDIAAYRRSRGENQSDFWKRFGVTQSGGSRYETGRSIPLPIRALLVLYFRGTVSEAELESAMTSARKRAI
jgi:DNA-binding transcriptional regulator YiaG